MLMMIYPIVMDAHANDDFHRFFAIKSGMMGWFFLNLSVASKQHQIEGTLSLPMILYQCFSMVFTSTKLIFMLKRALLLQCLTFLSLADISAGLFLV